MAFTTHAMLDAQWLLAAELDNRYAPVGPLQSRLYRDGRAYSTPQQKGTTMPHVDTTTPAPTLVEDMTAEELLAVVARGFGEAEDAIYEHLRTAQSAPIPVYVSNSAWEDSLAGIRSEVSLRVRQLEEALALLDPWNVGTA